MMQFIKLKQWFLKSSTKIVQDEGNTKLFCIYFHFHASTSDKQTAGKSVHSLAQANKSAEQANKSAEQANKSAEQANKITE
jgi:hypothetical protein